MPGHPTSQDADDDFDLDLDLDLGLTNEEETEEAAPAPVEPAPSGASGPSSEAETDVVISLGGAEKGETGGKAAPVDEFAIILEDEEPEEVEPPKAGPETAINGEKEDTRDAIQALLDGDIGILPDPEKEEGPVTIAKRPRHVIEESAEPASRAEGKKADDAKPEDRGAEVGLAAPELDAPEEEEEKPAAKKHSGKKTPPPSGDSPIIPDLPGAGRGKKKMIVFSGVAVLGVAGLIAFNYPDKSGPGEDGNRNKDVVKTPAGVKKEIPAQPEGYGTALENDGSKEIEIGSRDEDTVLSAEVETALRSSVEQFFSAESVEALLTVSRDPVRVEPLMREYYEGHGFNPREVRGVHFEEESVIGDKPIWLLEVQLDRFEDVIIAAEKKDDSFLIDWETRVYYNPVEWDIFVDQSPEGQFDMRVLATLHSEYRYPFTDDQKYLCVQLGAFGSDAEIFGYAERDSEAARKILEILTGNYTNESEYPLILTLEFPKDAQPGEGLVHIRDFVMEHWIIVEEG